MIRIVFVVCVLVLVPGFALADVLRVQPVVPGIWAIEGPPTQRNSANLANNATFGLIETEAGAVLVDPGGTWEGAAMLNEVVRELTDQPVTRQLDGLDAPDIEGCCQL